MLWLSKERNCCRFNSATFRLSWIGSLRCPFKKTFIEKRKKFLFQMDSENKGRNSQMESEVSEPMVNERQNNWNHSCFFLQIARALGCWKTDKNDIKCDSNENIIEKREWMGNFTVQFTSMNLKNSIRLKQTKF